MFPASVWISCIEGMFSPEVLIAMFGGMIIGTIIGILPGLSATMGLALCIPLTFWLPSNAGFAMLISLYMCSVGGGGISAIILNTPGTPSSIGQTFDGYPLYKEGKGGLALGINILIGTVGAIFGAVLLVFVAEPVASFTVKFSSQEYFAVALLGLCMMASVAGDNISKGFLMGFAGLLLACVGLDPMMGTKRFTFGIRYLQGGISYIIVMIGLFGVGEILYQIYTHKVTEVDQRRKEAKKENLAAGKILPTKEESKRMIIPTLWASIVGVVVGAIPAAGGDIAGIVAWGTSKSISKHPEEYGHGSIEGLAAASASIRSCPSGALITMLSLGIPGDGATAVLLGGMMMYGLQPGKSMFDTHPEFICNIMLIFIVSSIVFFLIGMLTVRVSAKALDLRKELVWVAVLIICIPGAYAMNQNFNDVILMLIFGLIGFLARVGGFPVGPMVLGLLLGSLTEVNLRRSLLVSGGNWLTFVTRPVSCVFLLIVVATFCLPAIKNAFAKRKKTA